MASSLVMFLRCNQFSIRVQFLPVTGRKCGGISFPQRFNFLIFFSGICDIKICLPPQDGRKTCDININCEFVKICKDQLNCRET